MSAHHKTIPTVNVKLGLWARIQCHWFPYPILINVLIKVRNQNCCGLESNVSAMRIASLFSCMQLELPPPQSCCLTQTVSECWRRCMRIRGTRSLCSMEDLTWYTEYSHTGKLICLQLTPMIYFRHCPDITVTPSQVSDKAICIWLRSKCRVCSQHICLWSWMRALSWYSFHRWAVQVLCVVTAQGGGRC